MKALQALTVLVKFGYYDDSDDVNDLLPSIQKLLNGKDDYPTKQIKQSIEGMGELQRRESYMQIPVMNYIMLDHYYVAPMNYNYIGNYYSFTEHFLRILTYSY